jgi:hypothetical protein
LKQGFDVVFPRVFRSACRVMNRKRPVNLSFQEHGALLIQSTGPFSAQQNLVGSRILAGRRVAELHARIQASGVFRGASSTVDGLCCPAAWVELEQGPSLVHRRPVQLNIRATEDISLAPVGLAP